MKKQLREQVYNKFNGLCAYSGTPLEEDWQVDHKIPLCMGGTNNIDNLIPCQKLINHYKRSLTLEQFRVWYLGNLHIKLSKLPKNPICDKSIKRKAYLLQIANYFAITEDKPFSGKFYFETIKQE